MAPRIGPVAKVAAALGDVSFSAAQRIWREHGVQPHRLERHLVSNDPDFEAKAADGIGLYLNPPAHAAVFCVDEKTAIQALDRKGRMLPLAPGRAESHGFEYKRNGTLSLFAALNTATGEVGCYRPYQDQPMIDIDTVLLAMAMAGLRLTTHVSAIRKASIKPLALAAVLFVWLVCGGFAINADITALLN